jgi:hypothetical protein
MKQSPRTLIEELDRLVPARDRHQVIEARASNVIASCINVMQLITEHYSEEEADELHKRLVGAIKNRDASKFNRKIREFKKNGTNDE